MICLVFPGQGSQSAGMGNEILKAYPIAKKRVDSALDKLSFDFYKIIDSNDVNKTNFSQVAIYLLSCAIFDILNLENIKPKLVAGHSLGEFSAAYASGSIAFDYGLELVKKRAELMDEASKEKPGAMAAVIGLSYSEVENLISGFNELFCANINSQNQIVISGSEESIDKSKEIIVRAGAKRFVKLNVGGAFHSSFMSKAQTRFQQFIDEERIADTKIPMISNITGDVLYFKKEIAGELSNQMCKPVNWLNCVNVAINNGIDSFIEVGPGNVLTNLIKRINPDVKTFNTATIEIIAKMPEEWIVE